jgi:hypothetical protein
MVQITAPSSSPEEGEWAPSSSESSTPSTSVCFLKHATLWVRWTAILPESRRTHAQGILHLQAGADSIRLRRESRQSIFHQFSIRNKKFIINRRHSVRRHKRRTSVRGCDLLKATAPKTFGTIDFLFKKMMTRTPSSISASFSSSEEIHVGS